MKQSDEKRIEELWLQGYGSKKIADELGINVNTVKSFCRRHGLSGDRQQKKVLSSGKDQEEALFMFVPTANDFRPILNESGRKALLLDEKIMQGDKNADIHR